MIQKQPFGKERSEKYRKIRSSRPEVFCINGVLRNFAKFTGKPATLLKKRLWHRCFPVNFVKFLRTTFFMEHLSWLLLELFLQGQDLKICGEDGQLSNIAKLHTTHALGCIHYAWTTHTLRFHRIKDSDTESVK